MCSKHIQCSIRVLSMTCQSTSFHGCTGSTGKVLHDADLVRRVDEAEARIAEQRIHQDDAEARIAELSIQQNTGSQTTQTAQKLGAVGLLSCLLLGINPAHKMACF